MTPIEKIKEFEKREMNKVMLDVKKKGFGIFDTENKIRINPEALSFWWDSKGRKKPREEVILRRDLMIIEGIFKEKFGNQSPYDLKLFNEDVAAFVERLIRAVEICSLRHVLNVGGSLNVWKKSNIVKGKRGFLWEH